MEIRYHWKTKFFSKKFDIYWNEILRGELFKEHLSRRVRGELNTKRYQFEAKGFLKREILITDQQKHVETGRIQISWRRSDAVISYMEKEYKWKFENFICSRWSLSDDMRVLIKYHSSAFSGLIESYTEDELLILSGFFIRNFIRKRLQRSATV